MDCRWDLAGISRWFTTGKQDRKECNKSCIPLKWQGIEDRMDTTGEHYRNCQLFEDLSTLEPMLQHADYVHPTSEGAIVLDVSLEQNVLNIKIERRERKSSVIGILTPIEPIDNSESR